MWSNSYVSNRYVSELFVQIDFFFFILKSYIIIVTSIIAIVYKLCYLIDHMPAETVVT